MSHFDRSEADRPQVRLVEISSEDQGQRIDNFLLRELKGAPRSLIYRLLRRGEVRINSSRAKPMQKLQAGDQVRIPPVRLPERNVPDASAFSQRSLEPNILFENNHFIVLNKPHGMAVHGGSGVSAGVIELLRHQRPKEADRLELAHRLDRDTSGCLVLTKKRSALRQFQELMRQGRVEKRYLALLYGAWTQFRQKVDVPLRKNVLSGGERIVRVDESGKASVTQFKVVENYPRTTLVEALLETGRTHQIRVHAAHLGTPILGDAKYGDEAANKSLRTCGLKRLFLHAASISFTLPEQKTLSVQAPLPAELVEVLKKLEKNTCDIN